ncbi:sensor histidine kinase [Salirhabdus salicampi]|uniref:sensor histidine kinase n=1 Tax=Salirhabdus salicampi TaxID=476102 RepID=UPI0020C3A1F0|nr:sensor histidine kinase [Salirhabdus salicampi]MCP8617889.1 sensor histidine kinase [Salirhabdus salicampi]
MQNWYNIFPKNKSLSIYVWIIFSLLPFYFIFKSTMLWEIVFGFVMIILFFVAYRLSFLSNGWFLYVCVSIMICISVGMSLFYGYVYFSLFLAFYIGNVQHKGGFITLYIIHVVTTITAASLSVLTQRELFFSQWPFIGVTILGVVLLPINTYNRIKRQKLEVQLNDAKEKISQLMVYEERQRIARDLHDTLGQKLTLIGLKSDLASRLIHKDINGAKNEITDINQTARTALKEVRDMLADMRGAKLDEELKHVQQLLKAANIDVSIHGKTNLRNTPALVEDVMSMCLKEAVTNIVKHSGAKSCIIEINETIDHFRLKIEDDGVGFSDESEQTNGHGLKGMAERLEFVNGQVNITNKNGTTIDITIPNVMTMVKQGEER